MDLQYESNDFDFSSNLAQKQDFSYIGLCNLRPDEEIDFWLGIKTPEEHCLQYQVENDSDSMKNEIEEQESVKTHSRTNGSSEDSIFHEYNFSDICEEKKESNNHHNFQKHTVTALRALITIEGLKKMSWESENFPCLLNLWTDFLAIKGKKIMTKKFLYNLFCAEASLVKGLKSYGFEKIFNRFNESEILCAQKELRKFVYDVFTEKNIREHVQGRNLQRKEIFIKYLVEYREKELGTGSVKKRMSKNCSKNISRQLA